MGKTKIEWADFVWNPVTGCSKVSEGCRHCYAEALARRFRADFKPWIAANAAHNVRLHPERLGQPFKLSKPRRIFVNSVSDLFHEEVPPVFIHSVFATMRTAKRHTFQILTKRAERMAAFLRSGDDVLPNVWIGVSAEDQPTFDERSRYLLQTPAAKRFVSLEPLLGPTDIDGTLGRCEVKWVIVGGESGPGARPMHPDWVRSIRDQCQAAEVPFFLKQWGEWLWKDTPEGFDGKLRALKEAGAKQIFKDGYFHRVGKKAAGNELDGRTWEEYPT